MTKRACFQALAYTRVLVTWSLVGPGNKARMSPCILLFPTLEASDSLMSFFHPTSNSRKPF